MTLTTQRSLEKVKEDAEGKKTERRQRIALEAAKQSGRSLLPAVSSTVSFAEAIRRAAEADIPLFCYEGEDQKTLSEVLKAYKESNKEGKIPEISVVIGSEGGFSLAEVSAAKEAGLISVGLGKRILRTETAASFALSCLVYELELS